MLFKQHVFRKSKYKKSGVVRYATVRSSQQLPRLFFVYGFGCLLIYPLQDGLSDAKRRLEKVLIDDQQVIVRSIVAADLLPLERKQLKNGP